MFAIIKTGGKQYIVSPGDKIKVEKLNAPEGKEVIFDSVLLVSDKDTKIGAPFVVGYSVKAKVLGQGKSKKLIVYKYKPKKRYHKKQGHRQLYTEVEILSIGAGERKIAKKKSAPKKSAAATAKKKIPAAKKTTKTKAPGGVK